MVTRQGRNNKQSSKDTLPQRVPGVPLATGTGTLMCVLGLSI